MNPLQKNKVDISSMSAEEQKLFRMYGKLPNKKDLLQNKLKERKYFDSGDYAMSKAGKTDSVGVAQLGREHPNPDTIPHLSSPLLHNERSGSIAGSISGAPQMYPTMSGGGGASPVKESSFLHRETSIDDVGNSDVEEPQKGSPASQREGMPIRGAR